MQRAGRLASVLRHEYLLSPPCAKQEDRLSQALDNLVDMGLLQAAVFPQVCEEVFLVSPGYLFVESITCI